MGDLGKLIVAKGFKKLPKVLNIPQSGHTVSYQQIVKYFPRKIAGITAYINVERLVLAQMISYCVCNIPKSYAAHALQP